MKRNGEFIYLKSDDKKRGDGLWCRRSAVIAIEPVGRGAEILLSCAPDTFTTSETADAVLAELGRKEETNDGKRQKDGKVPEATA